MKPPTQLIIIGGGYSLRSEIPNLWNKINNKFVIGTNYSHVFYTSTIQTFVDIAFYNNNIKELSKLSLIIGRQNPHLKLSKNTICLKTNNIYNRDLKNGTYKSILCGLFSLTLGIYLLDIGEIFLLGFDNGYMKKNDQYITHWYQDLPTKEGKIINHKGISKINYYDNKLVDKNYEVYREETRIKIYNVSLDSNINTFSKITYNKFYDLLDDNIYNQEFLRDDVRNNLLKL